MLDGMTCEMHAFDAREGGAFRISLTYEAPPARERARPFGDFSDRAGS